MSVLTGVLTGDGAVVDVELDWSVRATRAQRQALRPVPPAATLRAMIDPGADATAVDPSAVLLLGLPFRSIAFAEVPGATGVVPFPQVEASLVVIHPSGQPGDNLV